MSFHSLKYRLKLLLNLNARLGTGVIFEVIIENKSSHHKSNDSAANVIKR